MRFSGTVGKGKGYGGTIGFPTANIPLSDKTVSGIYAATVVFAGAEYIAAVYADQERGLLEAHLIDFSGDLYGKEIIVSLGKRIRDGKAFPDERSLQAAIAEDVARIRAEAHH